VVDVNDGSELESRPPTLADLVGLCRRLNEEGARYIVVGGMAIIQAGFVRATEDVDLLIDASPENVAKVKRAMASLPDNAARDVNDDDVEQYVVVRVADEIVVDGQGERSSRSRLPGPTAHESPSKSLKPSCVR